MLLGPFAAAERGGIQAGEAGLEFAQGFADGLAVLAQVTFCPALPPTPEFRNGAGHKAAPGAPFERLGRFDEQLLERVRQFHWHVSQLRPSAILPHPGMIKVFGVPNCPGGYPAPHRGGPRGTRPPPLSD